MKHRVAKKIVKRSFDPRSGCRYSNGLELAAIRVTNARIQTRGDRKRTQRQSGLSREQQNIIITMPRGWVISSLIPQAWPASVNAAEADILQETAKALEEFIRITSANFHL